jgi:hypothetical protein
VMDTQKDPEMYVRHICHAIAHHGRCLHNGELSTSERYPNPPPLTVSPAL